MRNSIILFVVALLVAGWFGSEVAIAQEICATSCITLAGTPAWEQAVSVAVLPVLLALGGFSALRKENQSKKALKDKSGSEESHSE